MLRKQQVCAGAHQDDWDVEKADPADDVHKSPLSIPCLPHP